MKNLDARKFNTVIELLQVSVQADGFGGTFTTSESIGEIFARYEEPRTVNQNFDGTSIDKIDAIFYIRKREIDTNVHRVKYKDQEYLISSFETTFLNTQMKIRCSKV